MLLDDLFQPPAIGKFIRIVFQFDGDFRAPARLVRWSELIRAFPCGTPAPGLVFGPVGAGSDSNLIGHHKDRIEAHAKLADHLIHTLALLLCALQKAGRAGMGNRAQILDQLLPVHTNAGVADRQRLVFPVRPQDDSQFSVSIRHVRVGQHFKLNAVECVRAIGNQFPQENLPLGVEGVG